MRWLVALILVGCTSTAVEQPTDYPYPGFPRVVPISEVPRQMRSALDGRQAVAVAPGVWTQYVEGITPEDAAQDGSYVGYCAAVDAAVREVGSDSGSTCW